MTTLPAAEWTQREDLALVPSLNATPRWADAVAAIARRFE